jgi:hypothetical protein
MFPWQAAYAIYLGLMLAGIGLATFLLLRVFGWSGTHSKLALVTTLLSPVVFINLFQGQTTWLLYLGLALAMWLSVQGRALLAGLSLSLTLVKPHLGIPLLIAVACLNPRSLPRLIGGFGAGTLVAFGVATLLVPSGIPGWVSALLGQWSGPLQETDLASVDAFFAPALSGWPRQISVLLILGTAAALAIRLIRRLHSPEPRALTVLIMFMAAAPYAHSYDTLLLVPVLLALIGPSLEGWKDLLTEVGMWTFMIMPLGYFLGFHLGYFNGFAAIPVVLLTVAWVRRHWLPEKAVQVQVAA